MTAQSSQPWSVKGILQDWLRTDFCFDPAEKYPLHTWRRWIDWDHLVWLIYLVFWFVQPYEAQVPLRKWLLLAAALVVFVPLFLIAHKADRGFRWIGVLGLFVLGLVYVPINQSACGIFIYVAVAIPEVTDSINGVMVLLLLESAAIAVETLMLHLSVWVWSVGIGFSVLFGMNRLRMKQKGRDDAKLRMAHEEIEQLAKTAERERIARDMHDVLGHSLSLIVLKSELAGRLLPNQPGRAALEIAEVENAAREALAEVRKTITGYRSEGFASELAHAAHVLETAGVRLQKPAKPPYLTPRHEATLSLVLREAVTNIVRHASASQCSIELSTVKDSTQMVIADDGRGEIRHEGNGLRGMRERVQELGGSLSLQSDRGTRLEIILPQFREGTQVLSRG